MEEEQDGGAGWRRSRMEDEEGGQTQADPGAISKIYPADYCNLTEFFEFPCESISVSANFY